jgi:hypothetical protein
MNTRYCFEELDIHGVSVAEAIAALQAWETENPDATESSISVYSDEASVGVEVTFQRPLTELEINIQKIQQANYDAAQEARDRLEYDRLKAKFEGN